MTLTSFIEPRDSIKGLTDMVSPVSLTTKTPLPKAQVSQLESSSALSAFFRLGTAAARIDRRADHLLGLVIPGPFLEVSAGGSTMVTEAAVRVPEVSDDLALAALHLAISSGERVLHSAGV